jgi:TatD DNase family protein
MLIDTHAHLYAKQFDEDRSEMMERAFEAGVEAIYLPNIDGESIESMLALESAYPGKVFAMMGLHPCYVKEDFEEELARVEAWLNKRKFCAIGEIGIDLYWDKTFVAQQEEAFLRQVQWAKDFDLPFVIHSRESIDQILDLLEPIANEKTRGIFHCFTGTLTQAQRIQELGFLMGIGGVLTFKNSGLKEVVRDIPLESLVVETDAPYLAPTPYRGKRNESSYVRLVAQHLADLKQVDIATLGAITTQNAKKLFKHPTILAESAS